MGNVPKGAARMVPWAVLILVFLLSRYAYAHFVSDEVFEDFHRYYQALAVGKTAPRAVTSSHAAILEGLLQGDPSNPRGWASLGNVYYDVAQKKEGAEFTDAIGKSMDAHLKAIALAPTWPDYWLYLGRAKIFAGYPAEGLGDMEHAVELSPASVDLYLYLILSYWHAAEYATWEEEKQRMKDRAFQWLEAATKLPGGIRSDSVWFLQPALNTEANQSLLSGLVREWQDRQASLFLDKIKQGRKKPD
ncbi:MAG: hypothetical protein HYT89_01425 [Candidatus Omnitrophica bacterium]|nr:hypothetical protein [Candidatus Omnitrophota bacterium]